MNDEVRDRFTYAIDATDRIDSVSAEWLAFAARNDSPHLTERSVIGRSLFDFITEPTTAQIYRIAIQRVRDNEESITVPFRCDGPHCRRFMELHMSPRADGGVCFESRLLQEEPRPTVMLLDATLAHGSDLLKMCSWCKRLMVEGTWMEVEEAIARLRLFDSRRLPEVSHGICPQCREGLMDQVQKSA
ncbi:MAG: hypothetical protein U5S82_12550 [Gammaproteobacteria bacterium]|nr:hypothetical protein [Gammaproteobacteria bacterium]